MRLTVQRVANAKVEVDDKVVGFGSAVAVKFNSVRYERTAFSFGRHKAVAFDYLDFRDIERIERLYHENLSVDNQGAEYHRLTLSPRKAVCDVAMPTPPEKEVFRLLIPSVVAAFGVRVNPFANSVNFQVAQNSPNLPRIFLKIAGFSDKFASRV